MLNVTEEAQTFLMGLLDKKSECIGVKIQIENGGTPKATTALSYCSVGEVNSSYQIKTFGELDVYVHIDSERWLEEALIDYNQEKMGGNLTIKAPNSKAPKLTEDSSLHDRVNYALWNDVYPIVAQHGGEVSLVEITDDMIAILEFGGGCKGCAGIDITLKEGVETALSQSVPEIKGIRDITDHTDQSGAYITDPAAFNPS
jgi:Fe/S biogenesis protein NfuA